MHAQRGYKIYICSVILGKLESFRNYEGFSIIFPKILDKREIKIHVYGIRQTANVSGEFLRIENKQTKKIQNDSCG